MNIQSSKIPSTNIQDPSVDAVINWIGTGSGENRLLSGTSNINYKYADKYMFQTILRADAHSSFGANHRWGMFYGISLGWRFSNESWLNSIPWLGESMFRIGYGVSGRQPGDVYARFSTYESTTTGAYILDPAIAPTRLQLNNLRWETIASWNFGGEFSLFKDRLFLKAIYTKS